MENFPLRGLTIIEEDVGISATPLILTILKRLQNVSYDIKVVALLESSRELEALFDKSGLSPIEIHSFEISEFDKIQENLLAKINQSDKQLIYIPNGDVLLRFLGVDKALRLLHKLSRNSPLITRIFHESWDDLELSRLHHISTNILKLSIENKLCICETRVDKKDGLVGKTLEQFTIDSSNLTLKSQAYQPQPKYQVKVEEDAKVEKPKEGILPKTTFDMGLNLSEEERRSKAATRLPYTHAQNEQGLVSLNITSGRKIRAGGQIIYTPDEHDDLDDSDPDDDLMV